MITCVQRYSALNFADILKGLGVLTLCGFAVFNLALSVRLLKGGLNEQSDFSAFYRGWRIVREGEGRHLYDLETQKRYRESHAEFLAYLNPPHLTVPFVPFASFSRLNASRMWITLNFVILAWCARLLWVLAKDWSQLERCIMELAFLGSPFLLSSLTNGTFTLLVLLCLLKWYGSNSGVWLALATVKPQIAVGPTTISARRSIAVMAAVLMGLVVLSILLFGANIWVEYIRLLRSVSSRSDIGVHAERMWNVRGWLVRAGLSTAIVMPFFVLSMIGCYLLPRVIQSREILIALAVTLAMLTSPHTHFQDALILVLPAVALYEHSRNAIVAFVAIGTVILGNALLFIGLPAMWSIPTLLALTLAVAGFKHLLAPPLASAQTR